MQDAHPSRPSSVKWDNTTHRIVQIHQRKLYPLFDSFPPHNHESLFGNLCLNTIINITINSIRISLTSTRNRRKPVQDAQFANHSSLQAGSLAHYHEIYSHKPGTYESWRFPWHYRHDQDMGWGASCLCGLESQESLVSILAICEALMSLWEFKVAPGKAANLKLSVYFDHPVFGETAVGTITELKTMKAFDRHNVRRSQESSYGKEICALIPSRISIPSVTLKLSGCRKQRRLESRSI